MSETQRQLIKARRATASAKKALTEAYMACEGAAAEDFLLDLSDKMDVLHQRLTDGFFRHFGALSVDNHSYGRKYGTEDK